jgi:hypothetical protein
MRAGAPVTADAARWAAVRSVVAGRLVNGFTHSDWLLRYGFRLSASTLSVAGLMPVRCEGVENADFSQVVNGHAAWGATMDVALRNARFQG